ncbi:MAG: hypothetical protein JJU02_14300 [Cryomorphaceae bacterium]|nr:hypothetical protein [Cryomorphaceae bacterium]
MISIKIEGNFEPEQVRVLKTIDKEDFGRKGLFGVDSVIFFGGDAFYLNSKKNLCVFYVPMW